jgi:hypothetical protein
MANKIARIPGGWKLFPRILKGEIAKDFNALMDFRQAIVGIKIPGDIVDGITRGEILK